MSRVAEEALRAFLLNVHLEAADGLSGRNGWEEASIVAGMVLELLRHQFPSAGEMSDEELRRRAVAARGSAKGRR